jgi:hypothetical protein
MSPETSRPRSVLRAATRDATPTARHSQRNEPEIAMDPVTGTGDIGTLFGNTLWPCLDPPPPLTSQELLSPGSHSSVLGRRCARDQMMVSSTIRARVGFWSREPSVGSLAVAAGKGADGSVVIAMAWLDLLIALRSNQIQPDPLPTAPSQGRVERFAQRLSSGDCCSGRHPGMYFEFNRRDERTLRTDRGRLERAREETFDGGCALRHW